MKPSNPPIDEVSLMFEAARSFIGGAKIIIASDGIEEDNVARQPTLPVIVCSTIAIEIELKTLLKLHNILRPSSDGHDLKLLFEALPPGLQLELLQFQVTYTGIREEVARTILYEGKDVFKTWRYPYEEKHTLETLEAAPAFLFGFALALSAYIKSKVKIERSENGWIPMAPAKLHEN
ncbi:MAG: hypothetical protein ACYCWB_02995 [Thiobacillus sp.]